jgi:ankyrin repeat protein
VGALTRPRRALGAQVKVLLQGGAKVDRADSHGQTPLHHATLRGRTQMVEVLLKLGANPLTPDRRRMTSLHCAGYAGHEDILGLLLGRAPAVVQGGCPACG